MKPLTLKDHYRESQLFSQRLMIAVILITGLSLLLLARMYFLQVVQYDYYVTQSERNRIRVEPIAPTRGLIRDANGVLLAKNAPSYSVSITKEQTPNVEDTLNALDELLDLTEAEYTRFIKRTQRRTKPYQPVPLRFNLSEIEIAKIAVNQYRLPGVSIEADLVRDYPYGDLLAHVIGYVGKISEHDEQNVDETNYAATFSIGKTGLERAYETQLHGVVGYQTIESNARGKVLKTLERFDPKPGRDLQLHLDLNIQKTAIQALAGRKGAVVAVEIATGGVKAMVSQPSFDPGLFVKGIDVKSYNELSQSEDRPLFDRVLKGQYPPGSTVKPFVALAGLYYQKTNWDRRISDPGFYQLEGEARRYRDWKKNGHGLVDLTDAVVQSCDTYFYDLAHRLGVDALHEFLTHFGFGRLSGIDIGGERSGLLPSSRWKRSRYGQVWYPGETLMVGIGQGYMLATPLQLAVATAILANRGKPVMLRLVKEDLIENNSEVSLIMPDPRDWERVEFAMTQVVHGARGTAKRIAQDIQYQVAGKTGTAQVIGIKQDEEYDEDKIAEKHRDHALFVAFAPADDPKLAVAVIVENGGHGGSAAAPVAREVFDAYLLQDYTLAQ